MILGGFTQRQLPTLRITAALLFVSHSLDTKYPPWFQVSALNFNSSFAFGLRRSLPPQFGNFHIPFDRSSSNSKMKVRQDSTIETIVTSEDSNSTTDKEKDPYLPTMIVFDLDDCLWSPEMHELPGLPSVPIEGDLGDGKGTQGIVGLKVPRYGPTVYLFNGARQTLSELATNPKYRNIILATASSSLEPSYSRACLEAIEIVPGVTMSDMFQYNQIGRTGRLTSNKKSHFRNLHEDSGVPYEEMLFFDDCNWGDHVSTVNNAFGVVGYRTPSGLQYHEFEAAMKKYRKHAMNRQASSGS